jgi:hypothetical protein
VQNGSVGRSLAEESLDWLTVDRARQVAEWRERMGDVPRLLTRLDARPRVASDFIGDALDEMKVRLSSVVERLVPSPARRFGDVEFAGIKDEEAFAVFTPFEDGSSRVLISDGLIGLFGMLSDLACVWHENKSGTGWRAAFRHARELRRVETEEELVPVLSVAIRWNLIHRRLWGKSATLPVESSGSATELIRDVIAQSAWIFILAHESAHCVLGHTGAQIGDWDAEREADALALRITYGAMRVEEGASQPLHALLGAYLALTGINLIERVLFIRPPSTHPPPADRWAALVELVGETDATKTSMFAAGLDEALRRTSNLTYVLPAEWWSQAYAHPQVHCDVHEAWYYEMMPLLDRLSFGGPEDPARILKDRKSPHSDRALDAASMARGRGLRAGLDGLGVDSDLATVASDSGLPLSVFSLVECVYESPALQALPEEERRIPTLCTATLLGGLEKKIF